MGQQVNENNINDFSENRLVWANGPFWTQTWPMLKHWIDFFLILHNE